MKIYINYFHNKCYFPIIEKLKSHTDHIISIGFSAFTNWNINGCVKLKNNYAEKGSEITGINIQSKYCGVKRQVSTERSELEFFQKK